MIPPTGDSAEEVLQSYLDALLQPSTDTRPFAEPEPLRLRQRLPPLSPPPAEPVAPVAVAAEPASAPPVPVIEPPPLVESPPADALAPADWSANGRPLWAQARFEALLFSVGGLNLAVPLVELGSVHPLEPGQLTPIFGQAPWFLGLLSVKGGSVRAVDSARVVMPERYDGAMPATYRYLITLNGSDWGLAVDAIRDAVVLDPETVRWRGARGRRPWLAGTVVEQMCALLDVAQLTWMFHNADRRRGGYGGAAGAGDL